MLPAPSAPRSSPRATARRAPWARSHRAGPGAEWCGAEGLASRGELLQQRGDGRHGEAQAVAARVHVCLARLGHEALDVRGVLDRLARVVAPRVSRQFERAVDEAHGGLAREQRHRPADAGMRNRVAVAIEADIGELAGHDRPYQLRLEGMGRQGQQARLLVGEDLGDGPIALFGTGR